MLCFFAKTRQSSENCRGNLKKINKDIQRSSQISISECLCQLHYDEIRRRNNKRCSCPSTWGHSKSLHPHPIPSKYLNPMDKAGQQLEGYIPGTRWCNKCHKKAPTVFIEGNSSDDNLENKSTKRQKLSIT